MSDLKRYCFDHERVVLQQHVALHDDCDYGEAFITRPGTGDVLMSEADWRESVEPEATLFGVDIYCPDATDVWRLRVARAFRIVERAEGYFFLAGTGLEGEQP